MPSRNILSKLAEASWCVPCKVVTSIIKSPIAIISDSLSSDPKTFVLPMGGKTVSMGLTATEGDTHMFGCEYPHWGICRHSTGVVSPQFHIFLNAMGHIAQYVKAVCFYDGEQDCPPCWISCHINRMGGYPYPQSSCPSTCLVCPSRWWSLFLNGRF